MDGRRAGGKTDTITLRLPADQSLRGVALLVVGGFAVRVGLTLESLEDLEIAVEALLGQARGDGNVTLELLVADGLVTASVSPVDGAAVKGELEREPGEGVGLRRVLQTVADSFQVVERDGSAWLSVEKRVTRERGGGAGG